MSAAAAPQWQVDGKRMPNSNLLPTLLRLGTMSFVTPAALVATLPLTICCQLVKTLTKKCTLRRQPPVEEDTVLVSGILKPLKDRKYDIVLLGATGFTGQLAAAYLAKQYGNKISWAIAGRRVSALEEVKAKIGMSDLPVIVCDTSDEKTLHALVCDTRCVVSTAGPFSKYGTPVVKFCANYGTHYADITGEVHWVEEMIDRFDTLCKKTGARIVSMCGHDSVPWDLLTLILAEELKEKHGCELATVTMHDYVRAAPSGGTLETVFTILNAKEKYVPSSSFSPLYRAHDGTQSQYRTKNANVRGVTYSKEEKGWFLFFVMADANHMAVRRSNALNGYGTNVVYREGEMAPSLPAALLSFVNLIFAGIVLACPPLLSYFRANVLPKPGQGPSVKSMEHNFLHIEAHATGTLPGTKAQASLYFKTDPGYRDTARMLAEAGLCLALTDPSKLKGGPGVATPGASLGRPYLQRLCETGTELKQTSI